MMSSSRIPTGYPVASAPHRSTAMMDQKVDIRSANSVASAGGGRRNACSRRKGSRGGSGENTQEGIWCKPVERIKRHARPEKIHP